MTPLNMNQLMLNMTPNLNVTQTVINVNVHTISASRHPVRHAPPINDRHAATPRIPFLLAATANDWIKDTGGVRQG